MYRQLTRPENNVLGFEITGRVDSDDVAGMTKELEHAIESAGRVRVLLRLRDVDGVRPGAVWEDLKFTVKHGNDIERMAVQGDRDWERWLAKLTGVGAPTDVKYFALEEADDAWRWLVAA